ncbi:thioesterase family protein [Sphingomonas sp. LaA6.9]|uniref:acyl-CoA thioesterase n=1 Tax=Sphingomonas sp. LaA6.9 TaxID=2919914 RepID=UPI001F4F695B|nr:acyl-CoA thioesterase [Sphingomonas sp. LaA6.9]MCJ8156235.1 acyl-CoA thioesterase [Sphingomonas sp. LaA6.9]
MSGFEKHITAGPDDIDELGHVNNAVWVRWIQDMAVSHWASRADAAHADAYIWVVVRHEIDYLGNVGPGESVLARTWVDPEGPRGARFDRHVEFTGEDGKVRVRARSTWAIIDRASGRILRVPKEVSARFLDEG